MNYKFYITSEKAWDGMIKAISQAKKSIYLEMYIFLDNVDTHNFFDILKQKAKNGIQVRIIVDSLGSSRLNPETVKGLRDAGAEILFFSYWLRHTHKKILVVDEDIAFLGGVNIHKFVRKWNDLQIRFTGLAVKSVINSFAESYKMCNGKDKKILSYCDRKNIFQKTAIKFLGHQNGMSTKKALKKHYQERITKAKSSIIIVTPYFIPQRWFIGALHQAVLRGVVVEILLPRRTDFWMSTYANYFYISKFCNLGIKFYMHNKMLHAKAMVIDGEEGMIGSQNIDIYSFKYNLEAGVFFQSKEAMTDLNNIITNWKKDSVLFDPKMYKKTWIDYLLAPAIIIFRLILSRE